MRKLLELAERCEKLEPDWGEIERLNTDIHAITPDPKTVLPADYVRSLDAAMTLVDPRALWAHGSMEDGPFARLCWPMPDGGFVGGYHEAFAATVPLATCAAALRAIAQTKEPAMNEPSKQLVEALRNRLRVSQFLEDAAADEIERLAALSHPTPDAGALEQLRHEFQRWLNLGPDSQPRFKSGMRAFSTGDLKAFVAALEALTTRSKPGEDAVEA